MLRLSHSMAAGNTALDAFATAFRELAEGLTGGAVEVRVFSSGTLGQEREVVQQLQEGLVDFMVSGTAIWGSVAPRLQFFDLPFLWRDWDHAHGVVDGPVGREAADYMQAAVGVRPLAFGDSFGFRHVVTRSRDVTEPSQLRGLKLRTIQSPIYLRAVELMGASPTPMAFGEIYTSLQTGVIDGYEHDASTTLQQRFFEVARFMARTGHIAGVLGLYASEVGLARIPAELAPQARGRGPRGRQRASARWGPEEDRTATAKLAEAGMTIREIDRGAFLAPAEALWKQQAHELDAVAWLAGGGALMAHEASAAHAAPQPSAAGRGLAWATAFMMAAMAVVVGLQVVGRHVLHTPWPWTEEVARLLLVWLMCAGGIRALADSEHPRVTALVRLLSTPQRAAVDRGLQLVLLGFFLALMAPSWRLTVASAGERLPASGLSGAVMSVMLPLALVLMCAVLVRQLYRGGGKEAPLAWSLGAAGLALASVLVPLVAGAAPLVVLVSGFLVTAALGLPLAFTLALTAATYLLGIGGVSLTILPIKLLGGVDSFVLLAIPLFILGGALMESGSISERIVDLAMAIVGRVKGGLAMVVVVAEVLVSASPARPRPTCRRSARCSCPRCARRATPEARP